MTSHTGEKPYKCTQCDKSFRIKKSLTSHISLHTGNLPHKCKYCNAKFSYSNMLFFHLNKEHKDEILKNMESTTVNGN